MVKQNFISFVKILWNIFERLFFCFHRQCFMKILRKLESMFSEARLLRHGSCPTLSSSEIWVFTKRIKRWWTHRTKREQLAFYVWDLQPYHQKKIRNISPVLTIRLCFGTVQCFPGSSKFGKAVNLSGVWCVGNRPSPKRFEWLCICQDYEQGKDAADAADGFVEKYAKVDPIQPVLSSHRCGKK